MWIARLLVGHVLPFAIQCRDAWRRTRECGARLVAGRMGASRFVWSDLEKSVWHWRRRLGISRREPIRSCDMASVQRGTGGPRDKNP
jgi:hypothetical protein